MVSREMKPGFCWSALRRSLLSLMIAVVLCSPAQADLRVLDASFRSDESFPEFAAYWGDTPEEAARSLGGSIHVFFENRGEESAVVDDVILEGVGLREAVAFSEKKRKGFLHPASIYFASLPADRLERLVLAGEPVWWRVEPNPLPPGGIAEVTIRLRSAPASDTVNVALSSGGKVAPAPVSVKSSQPRFDGITFSRDLDRACLYLVDPGKQGRKPLRVKMDGQDITGRSTIGTDPDLACSVVSVQLKEPLVRCSFHVFEAMYDDGRRAFAGIRAWSDEFAYGMWGAMPGKESEVELARRYVRDLYDHNINVQMEMVGSAAVREFLKSDEGQNLCRELGIRRMVEDPGKGRTRNPYCFFLVDEPDCGDYRVEDVPHPKRVGSLAQGLVAHGAKLREEDPVTPQLLNVDMTYKPENWYVYGLVPDIFAADPYYQERLRETYWEHPEWLPLFSKATFIYAVGSICRSACAPNPLHLILNSVRHTTKERRFRYATPEEKRIEVYYALGAGAKGISYWWYTPSGQYYGVGGSDPEAKSLWAEIGLLGAEARTAGPVIERSCPAALDVSASGPLWVRSLVSGLDTVAVICVNDDYENSEKGTNITPVEGASVSVRCPAWLEPKDVFEVAADGVKDVAWKQAGPRMELDLGTVPVSRLVIATSDTGLRFRLGETYDKEFAARVEALSGERR